MREGPFLERGYYYPGDAIQAYLEQLPATEAIENYFLPPLSNKVAVMTHDDQFDDEIYRMETDVGIHSTWFVLAKELRKDTPEEADVQLHFDKEAGTLTDQINLFRRRLGISPKFNRIHRLLWRSHNFDFPLLAMNGILGDTTQIGTRPYRPTIYGKILPIWEVPFCISDQPTRFMATYSIADRFDNPFKQGLSPIVILSHPLEVCSQHRLLSCFHGVIQSIQKYKYQSMDLSTFYDRFLRHSNPASEKTSDEKQGVEIGGKEKGKPGKHVDGYPKASMQ